MPPAGPRRHVLLGRDHETYGALHVESVSVHTACAISAGADEEFAKDLEKRHVNEDAVLVLEDDRHTVLCAADAHFGREAAEELVTRLADDLVPVPENPERLAAVLDRIAGEKPRVRYTSETTLAICIYDRLFRQGFGLSFGDSSVLRHVPGQVPVRVNERTPSFVSLAEPRSLRARSARRFGFSASPGDLLLVYTDGIDECCYREPDRSLTPFALANVLRGAGDDVRAAVEAVARAALRGVDGHPGGQDNLVLAATRT